VEPPERGVVGGNVEKGELGVQLGSWKRFHESGEDENRSDVQRTRECRFFFELF
jgi:antirestriction protein ArdC